MSSRPGLPLSLPQGAPRSWRGPRPAPSSAPSAIGHMPRQSRRWRSWLFALRRLEAEGISAGLWLRLVMVLILLSWLTAELLAL